MSGSSQNRKEISVLTETSATQPHSDGLELYITPQNTCNLACDFCCEKKLTASSERLPDEILYGKLKPLYEKADQIWLVGGEVTIIPGMLSYLKFLGENYPAVNLAIITNGSNFGKDWSEVCIEHDVFVRFSMNGADSAAYERAVRYPHARKFHDRIRANLLSFIEAKRKAGRPFPRPGITAVVTEHSARDMPQFIRFACEHQLPAWMYMSLDGQWMISDLDTPAPEDWHLDIHRQLLELKLAFERFVPIQIEHMTHRFYKQAKAEAISLLVQDPDRPGVIYKEIQEICRGSAAELDDEWTVYRARKGKRPLPKTSLEINGSKVCPRPWNYMAFSADGTVTPCCRRVQKWGNILTQEIPAIINSPMAVQMRASMLVGDYDHCWGCCNLNRNPDSSYLAFYRNVVLQKCENAGPGNHRERLQLVSRP